MDFVDYTVKMSIWEQYISMEITPQFSYLIFNHLFRNFLLTGTSNNLKIETEPKTDIANAINDIEIIATGLPICLSLAILKITLITIK
ncbi:hypothetical protein EV102420_07_03280 [Pseudescherichia vulneris NBRC 102420]|uniref:Uncharacterized protein n=1 Tax=Pseudescherichia vulneris NBRC 102420 TaxID=1115515 RepID=A0A090VQY4_PSEVU|nr:hypothetical protein EV102420_07_03280 [Pseudescherichia vulneris NBRC 102420]